MALKFSERPNGNYDVIDKTGRVGGELRLCDRDDHGWEFLCPGLWVGAEGMRQILAWIDEKNQEIGIGANG